MTGGTQSEVIGIAGQDLDQSGSGQDSVEAQGDLLEEFSEESLEQQAESLERIHDELKARLVQASSE